MKFYRSIIYLFLILLVASCSEEFQQKLSSTPNALGSANEINVIADQELWDGEIGDTFRFYFEAAYPMLPRPESIFNVRHFTPEELISGPTRKELRTYLYLSDLSNTNSSTANSIAKDIGEEKFMQIKREGSKNNVVGRNKWASGQLIIYLAGRDKQDLFDNIKNSFSSISKKIYEQDFKQIKGYTYVSGYNKVLTSEIEEKLGVKIQIPGDYIKAKWDEKEKLFWVRKETPMTSLSIVIKAFKYENENQLTKEFLKDKINEFGKTYVKTNTVNSHLVVNDEDLPLYTNVRDINGQYTFEMRGIWEATHDYMGGPFFSYLIIDKSQKKLFLIFDFLLAPGKDKRDLMQQLELITNTVEIL